MRRVSARTDLSSMRTEQKSLLMRGDSRDHLCEKRMISAWRCGAPRRTCQRSAARALSCAPMNFCSAALICARRSGVDRKEARLAQGRAAHPFS